MLETSPSTSPHPDNFQFMLADHNSARAASVTTLRSLNNYPNGSRPVMSVSSFLCLHSLSLFGATSKDIFISEENASLCRMRGKSCQSQCQVMIARRGINSNYVPQKGNTKKIRQSKRCINMI